MSADPSSEEPARGRQALLDRVVEHLSASGTHDLTLRGIAAAVGTSHRMLIYHFGSLDGLVASVVGEVERRQRDAISDLAADPALSLGGLTRAMWDRVRAEDLQPFERLFFTLYSRGLATDPGAVAADLVWPWLSEVERLLRARGLDEQLARAGTRLGSAIARGLLLDLLATGDQQGTDEAMELWIRLVRTLDPSENGSG